MLVDCYAREDVFAQVPKLAQEIDPVLRKLNGLLDDDAVYQQVRADFGKRYRDALRDPGAPQRAWTSHRGGGAPLCPI
jgi:transposase, IS5 family